MAYMPKNGGQDEENSEQRDDTEVKLQALAYVLAQIPLVFHRETAIEEVFASLIIMLKMKMLTHSLNLSSVGHQNTFVLVTQVNFSFCVVTLIIGELAFFYIH
jgi:hypothetical protein